MSTAKRVIVGGGGVSAVMLALLLAGAQQAVAGADVHRSLKKVAISIGDASIAEGNTWVPSTLSVPVRLSSASNRIVAVHYATADMSATEGSDYQAVRGTLTFRPGEKTKIIGITVLGDKGVEANERFKVILSKPVNARIAKSTATATIENDDVEVPIAPIAAGSYQGATTNGNSVFFNVTADRTLTGLRVNDLPGTCDPNVLRIIGAENFGTKVFRVNPDGRFDSSWSWSGLDNQGDLQWTRSDWKVTAFFDNPTTVRGTFLWTGEASYKGTHLQCTSGEVKWSAARWG